MNHLRAVPMDGDRPMSPAERLAHAETMIEHARSAGSLLDIQRMWTDPHAYVEEAQAGHEHVVGILRELVAAP